MVMDANKGLIKKGIILSGLMNMGGVLVLSRFFNNKAINEADPAVMSNFGLFMIVVWGLAYIAVASKWDHLKWIFGVFIIEKFTYGSVWAKWLMNNSLASVYEQDTMAGLFYSVYGANDWLFCFFFIYVFIHLSRQKK